MITAIFNLINGLSVATHLVATVTLLGLTWLIRCHPRMKKLPLLKTILSLVMITIIAILFGGKIYHTFNINILSDAPVSLKENQVSPPSIDMKKTITIKNGIDPDMLKYNHWTGTYKPSTFVLSIKGKEIKSGNEESITVTDGILKVRFDYAFLNGKRKGASIITFEVDNDKNNLHISFNWRDKWQVIIDGTNPLKKKKGTFNQQLLEQQ